MRLFGLTKKKNKLSLRFTNDGIEYSYGGKTVPVFPLNANPAETLSDLFNQGETWSALESLWAEGLLESPSSNLFKVPYKIYDHIEEREEEDLYNALKIPFPESLKIELTSSSHVGDKDFRIYAEASHPMHGPLREDDPLRNDSVFILSENCIVPIPRVQADLFNAAKGEATDWENIDERMAYLAAVKKAAGNAGATFDSYIADEDYDFAESAGIDLEERAPDEIQLIPKIEGSEKFDFSEENLLENNIPTVITKPMPGLKRKRMVLGKALQNQLGMLPQNGIVKGSDVPKLLTQPETMIPEGFDMSLFSERVKGIRTRVYNSRPYIHINKNKGGWFEGIPGIDLDDWSPASENAADGESPTSAPGNLSEETYRKLAQQAKENGDEYILHEGNWIRIDTELAEKFENTLDQLDREGDIFRIPPGAILDIYENLDLLEFIDKQTIPDTDHQLPSDIEKIDPPASFHGQFYPHQLDGYRWLYRLSNKHLGGLLADDMGLGKTIQVIAHFLKLKESGFHGPHLVVVPKTLVVNWQREIDFFSKGTLSTYICDNSFCRFDDRYLRQFDVVVTTYDTLRRNQAQLGTVGWNMVVCDEAQYAKNPTTQRTCAVKALKAKHRAALTGTPVENGLIEFWCIMDFVQPGLLGSWADFRKNYERPIIDGDEEERESKINTLLNGLKGYYLRRLKEEALDLPDKIIDIRETCLSDQQFEVYKEIAAMSKAGGRGAMLAGISRLIRFCAYPESEGYRLGYKNCPKMQSVIEILGEVKQLNEKAIIFTDFKKVQRGLQDIIREKFEIWPDIVNGEITNNRQQIIDIFSQKDGFNVIILGHQVAGVGLNITSANHVIHYTRPWNPAKENQATDRAHRIGQSKPVKVYYPIVKDERFKTVDERLAELIESKSELARDVLRPTKEMQVKTEELLGCYDVVN